MVVSSSPNIIPEPGDANCDITVTETFHLQKDDELFDKELKQIKADDQAIQTIFLGIPKDIYPAVDSCKTAQEIWPRREWSRHVTIVHQTKDLYTADYTQLYDFLKYNQKENYLQQPRPNPKDITDRTTAINMALALMAKAFKLNYSTPTNNNQRISSNPGNRQIAQPARAEGNASGQNENQIRCYNYRGVEEYDLMAATADLDEIEEINANCILMANLQQASTLSTQTDSAPVYDTDGSAEEAAKFVGNFKSLANEADTSLAKHKELELEIERLLKAVVSQDIMIIVQNESVVDTSDL
nr:hypothetical protein [Tanacetum cinerariifolium]